MNIRSQQRAGRAIKEDVPAAAAVKLVSGAGRIGVTQRHHAHGRNHPMGSAGRVPSYYGEPRDQQLVPSNFL